MKASALPARFCGACSQLKLHIGGVIHSKMCNLVGVNRRYRPDSAPERFRSLQRALNTDSGPPACVAQNYDQSEEQHT